MDNWQGYLKVNDLIEYLRNLNLCYILLHTEANVRGCKIYGNPITSRQDWIEVEVDGDFFQVQCLIFFKLDHMLENEIATPLHTVSGPGTYAIVHFMGLDVFGEPDHNMKLYGHIQKFFPTQRLLPCMGLVKIYYRNKSSGWKSRKPFTYSCSD